MTQWYFANLVLIQTTLIYVLLSLSFQVVLRSGVFSFAGVGFYGLGGYTVAILTLREVNGLLAFLTAIAGAVVVGALLSLVVSRLRSLYLALFTVAFNLILTVLARNGGELTGGPVGLFGVPTIVRMEVMVALVVVAVLVVRQLERGSIGRSFEALRLNEDLARSAGLEVARRRNTVFVLSAVLGASAGALNTFTYTTVSPGTAGFHLVTTGLTMAVLGGIGRWQGAVVGAVIVAWVPSLLGEFGDYQVVVNGIMIMILVVFAPDGVTGLIERGWRRLRRTRSRSTDHPAPLPAEALPVPAPEAGRGSL